LSSGIISCVPAHRCLPGINKSTNQKKKNNDKVYIYFRGNVHFFRRNSRRKNPGLRV
jgi:ubiquitin